MCDEPLPTDDVVKLYVWLWFADMPAVVPEKDALNECPWLAELPPVLPDTLCTCPACSEVVEVTVSLSGAAIPLPVVLSPALRN